MTAGSITLSGVTFSYSNDSRRFAFNKDATIYYGQGAVYSINDLGHSDYSANTDITRENGKLYLIKLK